MEPTAFLFKWTYLDLCTTHVVWADADGDDDVDQVDFSVFQICFGWAGNPYPPDPQWCRCFDRNGDGSVEAGDLAEFEECATGPSIPWSREGASDCRE